MAVVAGFLLFVFWQAPNTAAWPSWYEWVAFGSLVLGPTIVVTVLFRQGKPATLTEATGTESQTNRSLFHLRDALLAFVIAGIVSATAAAAIRKPLTIDWLAMLGTAGCIAVVSVAAACFVLIQRKWVISAVLMVLAIAGSTALHTWALPDWAGMWWITGWVPQFKVLLFGFVVLAVAVIVFTYLLLVCGAFAEPGQRPRRCEIGAKSARIALVCVCAALFGPLAVVYCRMLPEVLLSILSNIQHPRVRNRSPSPRRHAAVTDGRSRHPFIPSRTRASTPQLQRALSSLFVEFPGRRILGSTVDLSRS